MGSQSLVMNTWSIFVSVGLAEPLDHVNRRPCIFSSLISNSSMALRKEPIIRLLILELLF
jgi:hypothetical protein